MKHHNNRGRKTKIKYIIAVVAALTLFVFWPSVLFLFDINLSSSIGTSSSSSSSKIKRTSTFSPFKQQRWKGEGVDEARDYNIELLEASQYLLTAIEKQQNPKDCSNAEFMSCTPLNSCGAACELHQLVYCFMTAFVMEKVMWMKGGWQYLHQCPREWCGKSAPSSNSNNLDKDHNIDWNCAFEAVTRCTSLDFENKDEEMSNSFGYFEFLEEVNGDMIIDSVLETLPPNLKEMVRSQKDVDYRMWTVGHFVNYLLRFNSQVKDQLVKANQELVSQWRHPIAGMHVRCSDHSSIAVCKDLSEYMKVVEDWFAKQSKTKVFDEKRIFIATDEFSTIEHAKLKYPQYRWLYSPFTTPQSSILSERNSLNGLMSILSDWTWLSNVDLIVGTGSSYFSNVAFELAAASSANNSKHIALDGYWIFP